MTIRHGGPWRNALGTSALGMGAVGTSVSSDKDKVQKSMEAGLVAREPAPQPPMSPAAGAQRLEPDVQAHLGRQLRAVYDEMASEPVPDRFIQLLEALERKQAHIPAGGGAPAVHAGKKPAGGV